MLPHGKTKSTLLQPMHEEPAESDSLNLLIMHSTNSTNNIDINPTATTTNDMNRITKPQQTRGVAYAWRERIFARVSAIQHDWKRNRRKYLVTALTLELLYLVISIPLRFGLYYDPFYDTLPRTANLFQSWTLGLTALTVCDAVAEVIAVLGIFDLFEAQRRAIAERAHLQTRELFELQRNLRRKPRKEVDPDPQQQEDDLSTVWTLGTILPLDKQRHHQIRGALLFEIIAIFPMEFLCFAWSFNTIHILRFLKLFRLYRTPEFFREARKYNANRAIFRSLSKIGMPFVLQTVFIGMVLCHWMACGLLALAHFQCGIDLRQCDEHAGKTCWALHDQLEGASNHRRYARAIYWSSRTLITAGFNDVTPVTNTETLYVVMVEVIGAVFSTSLIASFLFLFRYQNQRSAEFYAHVDKAKEYMQLQKIPQHLKDNVMDYFNHMWEHHRGLRDEEILDRLPEHLRVTLESVLKTQRLQRVPFLAKESIEFINTLSKTLLSTTFAPNDWIIELKSEAMFFVVRGLVLLQNVDMSKSRQCGNGDFFAEACLLFPERRFDEKANAITFCEIYQLRQQDFLKTLALFHRKDVLAHLERMKAIWININHQKQKMKRVFGMNQAVMNSTTRIGSTNVASSAKSSRGSVEAGVMMSRISVFPTPVMIDWRSPGSRFRRNWKRARWLFLLFVAFDVPLFIVFNGNSFPFNKQSKFQAEAAVALLAELFFMADFALRCRLFSYVEPMTSMVIHDPTFIFDHYRDNGFWYDLVAVVPIALILQFVPGNVHVYETIFRLLRLLRLHEFWNISKDVADMSGLSSKSQRAIGLILSVTYSLHFSSCIWFATSRIGFPKAFVSIDFPISQSQCLRDAAIFGNCTWTVYDCYHQVASVFPVQDPNESIYHASFAYLRSIYWSIVALTTVGYGDITPFSTYETCYAAMWTFIGGIINYAALGAMSSIIANLTAQQRQYSEQLNLVNRVMAHYHISEDIRNRIRKYHQRQFEVKKASYESDLLSHLPHRLGKRISWILHAESFHQVPLFHFEVFDQRIIYEVAGLFRNRIFHPGDSFFMENNECKEMFVIVRGKVDMFHKNLTSTPFGALSEGDYYGVNEMILGKNYSSSLVAASMAHVAVIGRDGFISCLSTRYPREYQKLKKRAFEDYCKETLRQDAVCANLKNSGKLTSLLALNDSHRKPLAHHVTRRPGRLQHTQTLFLTRHNPARSQNIEYEIRFYWNWLITILNVYNGFEIIFRICFLSNHVTSWEHKWFIVFNFSSDVIMACDIYLKLYYFGCEGDFSNLYKRNHKNTEYAGARLIRDLWSSLPLYYVGPNAMIMSLCRLPRLIRLLDMPQMTETLIVQMQQRVASGGNVAAYVSPIKQLLMLLFAAHWAACIFYFFSHEEQNPHMWIEHDTVVHQQHGSVGVLYLRSIYWALTTLTLVGSEEVVPIRTYGTIWAAITCLCCTFVVGDIVGTLSELILEMDKNKKELQEKAKAFEEFAKNHNLPSAMRTRVLHFLRFQNLYRRGFDLQKFRADLSPNLQVQLMLDLYGSTLSAIPIAPFLIKSQVSAMAVRLQSELFIPGDNVVNGGDLGHKLYILKSGSAIVLWKNTSTIVGSIMSDMMFGEIAFFLTGKRRCATVQTTTCCEILVLDRKSWEEVLLSCRTGESERCEMEILDWVRKRLKVYNSMAMEIIHDIQLALSQESQLLRRFKTQPSVARSSASSGRSQRESAASPVEMRRIKRSMLEKTVRHMLRDIESDENQQKGFRENERRLSASIAAKQVVPWWRRLFQRDKGVKRGKARVYIAGEEKRVTLHEMSSSDRIVPLQQTPSLLRRTSSRFRPTVQQGRRSITAIEDRTLHAINPLRTSIRGVYDRDALELMEKECWRGHRTTILMELTATQSKCRPQETSMNGPSGSLMSSVFQKHKDSDKPMSPMPRRKSDLDAFMMSKRPSTNNSESNMQVSAADDGKVIYAAAQSGIRSMSTTYFSSSGVLNGQRRDKRLVRSRSLPFFDAKFAQELEQAMEQERIQASRLEAQTWSLNFELLQRYRRPELSTMFVFYSSLHYRLHKAHEWLFHRFSTSRKLSSNNSSTSKQSHKNLHIKPAKHKPVADSIREEEKREHEVSQDFVKLSSRISRAWETLMVFVALFYAIMIPYMVCFGSDSTSFPHDDHNSRAFLRYLYVVDLANALCIIDYLVKHRFNVGSATDSDIVQQVEQSNATNHNARRRQRMQKWKTHFFEIISSMPFDLCVRLTARGTMDGQEWLFQALFQLPKLLRLAQAQEASLRISLFLTYDLRLPIDEAMLRFGRSIVTFCLAGHWIACIWFAVSLHGLRLHPHYSWLITPGMLPMEPIESLGEVSLRRKYIRSLHFAVGSISTVFYGDIASQNVTETLAELAVILCSIFIYGILVGAHGERIETHFKRKAMFEQNMAEMYHFVITYEVPQDVQQRLKLYFRNTWLKTRGQDEINGVEGLSSLLMEEITSYTLRSMASKVQIFQNCDERFLRALLVCLKQVICSDSEQVVRQGDIDRSMYLIAAGRILVKGVGFELIKEEGDLFGELSLLYGVPRSATCISLGTSMLYVLELNTYQRLLQDFPEYRIKNRRDWVLSSMRNSDPRFRAVIGIVATMDKAHWVQVEEIIRKARAYRRKERTNP